MAVTRGPMRSVHHTASQQSIIGGGSGFRDPARLHSRIWASCSLMRSRISTSTMDAYAAYRKGELFFRITHAELSVPLHACGRYEPLPLRILRNRYLSMSRSGHSEVPPETQWANR